MKSLTKTQIKKAVKDLDGAWVLQGSDTKLTRLFTFKNYLEAFIFVARITVHSEVLQHHPVILLSYGKVKVTLTTVEAKGLTPLDVTLATKIDTLYLST